MMEYGESPKARCYETKVSPKIALSLGASSASLANHL